jgi:mRNA-degrading endonuclease RelE of RelBE toxin-antitoxin system
LANVICSEQAGQSLESLPSGARERVEQRLEYLQTMPRMYAITDDDRFPGCRSFWVDPCYRVFYMVAASADDVYVVAVAEEEIDAPGIGDEF